MKEKSLVSILINNYNYESFLGEAIDSALSQTYPYTEVIVVDDGSTDNSPRIIASYKDQITPVLKENGGQASAFNAGLAASQGDIICFLDSDDTFTPEKVAEVVNVFNSHQEAGWCFHRIRLIDVQTGNLLGRSRKIPSKEYDFRTQFKRGKEGLFTGPPTSGLCFKRSLLQQILPMPEAITITSDSYLKLTALALSKGFHLDKDLAVQKIHGKNAYTHKANKHKLRAKILVLTAYWMRTNYPSLYRFTHRRLAKGISLCWRAGDVEDETKELIKNYQSTISPLERFEIILRALFYHLKS